MGAIWKFPFEVTDRVKIQMPLGAEVLSVQIQRGSPCIWARVPDVNASKETRMFRVYGTGHPIDEPGKFIGTFQMREGTLVFHLFETR